MSVYDILKNVSGTRDIYTWGRGNYGQLGHGNTNNQAFPRLVDAPGGVVCCLRVMSQYFYFYPSNHRSFPFYYLQHFRYVACGDNVMYAISENGQLFACGLGRDGLLGRGVMHDGASLIAIEGLPSTITHLAVGSKLAVALDGEGRLWQWGASERGELSRPTVVHVPFPHASSSALASSSTIAFRHLACGSHHALAVSGDGIAYSWGRGLSGQLGHGRGTPQASQPLPLLHPSLLRLGPLWQVAAAEVTSLFLTQSGLLAGCGSNQWGQLGSDPDNVAEGGSVWEPMPIQGGESGSGNGSSSCSLPFPLLCGIAMGWRHCHGIDDRGAGWSWGQSKRGALGLGEGVTQSNGTPQRIPLPSDMPLVSLQSCKESSAAVTRSGQLLIWGYYPTSSGAQPVSDSNGGGGDSSSSSSIHWAPQLVEEVTGYSTFLQAWRKVCAIAVGDGFNAVLVGTAEKAATVTPASNTPAKPCVGRGKNGHSLSSSIAAPKVVTSPRRFERTRQKAPLTSPSAVVGRGRSGGKGGTVPGSPSLGVRTPLLPSAFVVNPSPGTPLATPGNFRHNQHHLPNGSSANAHAHAHAHVSSTPVAAISTPMSSSSLRQGPSVPPMVDVSAIGSNPPPLASPHMSLFRMVSKLSDSGEIDANGRRKLKQLIVRSDPVVVAALEMYEENRNMADFEETLREIALV
jgi:alpha-tubulin suppressor-like RCC1 family protein